MLCLTCLWLTSSLSKILAPSALEEHKYGCKLPHKRSMFCRMFSKKDRTSGTYEDIQQNCDPVDDYLSFAAGHDKRANLANAEGSQVELSMIAHLIVNHTQDILPKKAAPKRSSWWQCDDFRKHLTCSNLAFLVAVYEQSINHWKLRSQFKLTRGRWPQQAAGKKVVMHWEDGKSKSARTKKETLGEIPEGGKKFGGQGLSSRDGKKRFESLHR